uniref:Uncharacterized protein n=1 Tax=Panagrolaimus sp. ES5 TaxID=591445 RepID=A0AC34G0C2_9BILA
NLLNDDNFVYNDGNVDAPVADETADFFGGAPDVEDMLLEPHVFQADIILGNFDTPTIPKKKQPAPPKKKEKPTKSIIPPASGRVTRSRTFAATPSAPETVEEAADIFGDVEDMILEPHVFDSDNIPGNFDYYADDADENTYFFGDVEDMIYDPHVFDSDNIPGNVDYYAPDADENTYFFGGAPDVGDMIYDPHVFQADNILGNYDHYPPAVDETADFFGGAPDLGDISFEPHLFDADITLSNFDF